MVTSSKNRLEVHEQCYVLEVGYMEPFWDFTLSLPDHPKSVLYLNIEVQDKELYIRDIYINDEKGRSNGLGTAVLSQAIKLAKENGFLKMYGYCTPGINNKVNKFYKRLGFDIDKDSGRLELNLIDNN